MNQTAGIVCRCKILLHTSCRVDVQLMCTCLTVNPAQTSRNAGACAVDVCRRAPPAGAAADMPVWRARAAVGMVEAALLAVLLAWWSSPATSCTSTGGAWARRGCCEPLCAPLAPASCTRSSPASVRPLLPGAACVAVSAACCCCHSAAAAAASSCSSCGGCSLAHARKSAPWQRLPSGGALRPADCLCWPMPALPHCQLRQPPAWQLPRQPSAAAPCLSAPAPAQNGRAPAWPPRRARPAAPWRARRCCRWAARTRAPDRRQRGACVQRRWLRGGLEAAAV